ncbi:MAG: hypothetical protein ACSHXL_07040, partial [Bacteroidota bacterium]
MRQRLADTGGSCAWFPRESCGTVVEALHVVYAGASPMSPRSRLLSQPSYPKARRCAHPPRARSDRSSYRRKI